MTNFSYRYDNVGNRLGATEVDGAVLTWTYDSTYQLTSEARSAGSVSTFTYSTSYTYDPLGNRLVKWDSGALTTSTYDAANQLETASGPAGVTTFTYDLAGNLTVQNAPAGITTSTWDNENRQSSVTVGTAGLGDDDYNADGLRFSANSLKITPLTLHFLWDGKGLLGFTEGSGVPLTAFYVREPLEYGGALYSYGFLFTGVYLAYDALGSMVSSWVGAGVDGGYILQSVWRAAQPEQQRRRSILLERPFGVFL